jgi:hypothetical protein
MLDPAELGAEFAPTADMLLFRSYAVGSRLQRAILVIVTYSLSCSLLRTLSFVKLPFVKSFPFVFRRDSASRQVVWVTAGSTASDKGPALIIEDV